MWSKAILCRFRQSWKVPQTQVLQGFAAFRFAMPRIPPRHSQTRRDTNFAIPGYSFFCHDTTENGKNKVFSVCGHSCGQSRFCAAFSNRGKSRKCRRRKALRRFALLCSGYRHGTPKPPALPTALIPDFWLLSFCARCGQTCGQADFLTISACGGDACVAGVSRDCGHGIFRLEGGATRSQTRRATNFAIPGYY